MSKAYQVSGYPTLYVIGAGGQIVAAEVGAMEEDDLRDLADQVLAKPRR